MPTSNSRSSNNVVFVRRKFGIHSDRQGALRPLTAVIFIGEGDIRVEERVMDVRPLTAGQAALNLGSCAVFPFS